MPKQLFIITYEGSIWCGASDTRVCVWALNEDDAKDLASKHMEEEMRELFADEYAVLLQLGKGADEDCAYSVNSVEVFDEHNENWKHFCDPAQQANFYPIIGSQE